MTKSKQAIALFIIILLFILYYIISSSCENNKKSELYNEAISLYNNKKYSEAADIFSELGLYENSFTYLVNSRNYIKYNKGIDFYDKEQFKDACDIFSSLGDFEKSKEKAKESRYAYAQQLYSKGNLEEAFSIFQELGNYKESPLFVANITLELKKTMEKRIFNLAYQYFESGDYDSALNELLKIEDFEESSNLKSEIENRIYNIAVQYYEDEDYFSALDELSKISDCDESLELKTKCRKNILRRQLSHTFSAGIRGSVAIKENGNLIYTGKDMISQFLCLQGYDFVSIDCFGLVSAGLTKDGHVITNDAPEVNTKNWEDIIQISVGRAHVVGLKSDGSVEATGHSTDGQCDVYNSEWKNIVSIATGCRHTVGLTEDGHVKITGYIGDSSHKNNVEKWSDIIAIAAGGGHIDEPHSGHTVGLTEDNRVVAAGDNTYGQCNVDDWEDIIAIAAGDWHTVGLKADGTVVATGYKEDEGYDKNTPGDPCFVSNWKTEDKSKKVIAIAANRGITLGLTADGTILATGFTAQGQRPLSGEWTDILRYREWACPRNYNSPSP